MKYAQSLAACSVTFLLAGCSTTRTITLHTEARMMTGEHMSCVYHNNNLFCASPLIKVEDIARLQIMDHVVSVVHSEEKQGDMKEGGAFATRFARSPSEYSLWDCTNTGVADPAVQCVLLREADVKLVAMQEQQIGLNQRDEKKLQSGLTEQDVVAKCGNPIEQKGDSISRTIYFPSQQTGQEVEVRFSTLDKPTQLRHIISVSDTKDHKFIPRGMFWNNYLSIGKDDEEHVAEIRQFFPCILK